MNIIKEITAKYQGVYEEEIKKSTIYASGKYSFHPEKGVFEVAGSKLSVNIQAVGGAAQVTEPYRIILYLKKPFNGKLEIYPTTILNKIYWYIFKSSKLNFSSKIDKYYSFKGNKQLIKQLKKDKEFCEVLKPETVYITLNKKHPKHILLKPAYGIDTIEQLERFIKLLKSIENEINSNFSF